MKKTILLAAIVSMLSATAVSAQTAPKSDSADKTEKKDRGNRGMNDRRGMNMYEDLNLSKDQQAKLKTLSEEGRKEMQTIRDNSALNDEQKKEKMQEFQKNQKEKRDKILTPEQSKKLEAKMKDRRSRGDRKPQADTKQ